MLILQYGKMKRINLTSGKINLLTGKKLEDVPYLLELPTDFQRPKIQTYQGGTYDLPLNRELSKKIKEFAKSKNTTVYNVLLTAFQVLLARYSKQEDF